MTMTKNNGGPAFPAQHFDLTESEHGMTLRDYFAAAVMPEIMARHREGIEGGHRELARIAYRVADLMLEVRNV